MKDAIIEFSGKLLDEGRIKGFVALKDDGNHVAPHVFFSADELKDLSLGDREKPGDARYPLAALLKCMVEAFPENAFGIMVRGCDERALNVLIDEARVTPLRPASIVPVGFCCPKELAEAHQCQKPWPEAMIVGEKTAGLPEPLDEETGEDMFEQLEFWLDTFNRCVKCFGCRNVCPVCACKECTIEREIMVPQQELPPSPNFLMTRAVHMVDRCVYCGLCEETCPADIPLKALYRFVARSMGQSAVLPGVRLDIKPYSSTARSGG